MVHDPVEQGTTNTIYFSVQCSSSEQTQVVLEYHTVLQKYAHIELKQNLLRSITLDIVTRLLDNATFVCIHVVGRFSKDFSEVRGLRSRGFQLQVEWKATVLCVEL